MYRTHNILIPNICPICVLAWNPTFILVFLHERPHSLACSYITQRSLARSYMKHRVHSCVRVWHTGCTWEQYKTAGYYKIQERARSSPIAVSEEGSSKQLEKREKNEGGRRAGGGQSGGRGTDGFNSSPATYLEYSGACMQVEKFSRVVTRYWNIRSNVRRFMSSNG